MILAQLQALFLQSVQPAAGRCTKMGTKAVFRMRKMRTKQSRPQAAWH
jgi:hypothetical protein